MVLRVFYYMCRFYCMYVMGSHWKNLLGRDVLISVLKDSWIGVQRRDCIEGRPDTGRLVRILLK